MKKAFKNEKYSGKVKKKKKKKKKKGNI